MSASTKQRPRASSIRHRNALHSREIAGFPAGSLEAELAAIGESVPAREWARLPPDYFARLDFYVRGATGKPDKK